MKRWISACATLVLATATVFTSATLQAVTYGHAAAQDGLATIKVNISGDPFYGKSGFGRRLSYTEAEVATASEEAHQRGAWLSCHARADESVKLALKYGFRVIYHCDFIEGETFDLL